MSRDSSGPLGPHANCEVLLRNLRIKFGPPDLAKVLNDMGGPAHLLRDIVPHFALWDFF